MKNMTAFFRQAFPVKKRTVLPGLGQGLLLVVVLWYPLPLLLEYLAPPKWMAYGLILVLLGGLFCLFLSGKWWMQEFDRIGWTACGYLASGVVLMAFFHGDPQAPFQRAGVVVATGVFLLAAYVAFSLAAFLKHPKG